MALGVSSWSAVMGVAAALAVAEDPSLEHGPLQMLFTTDEETGLTGAPVRLDVHTRSFGREHRDQGPV